MKIKMDFSNLVKFYTFWNKCSYKETHLVWKLDKSQQNLAQPATIGGNRICFLHIYVRR